MNNILPFGFALIPNSAGLTYVTKLNRAIQKVYPSEFILQEKQILLPHVSLFQGQFDEKQMSLLTKAIEASWMPPRKPIIVKSRGLNVWIDKIFFLDLEITDELISLQNLIIDSVDSLRATQFGSADPQKLVGLDDHEQISMDRFAYPFAGPAFRPHFTVGRIEASQKDNELENWILQNPIPNDFHFEKLVLFEVGMYGRLDAIRFQVA